jgi:adenylate cyclase
MSGTDLRQRLAAILAADVAGYSRLMAGDDRATVTALDAARAVFRLQIEANHGRVIDMAGDSVLAVFETATGAVSAGLVIQQQVNALAEPMPEERGMRFRIGIHLGDVIEKADGTVYGDGVNIAARLEGLAEPGGMTISDAVFGAVRGKVAATFEDSGEQTVKNIGYPVRAYALRAEQAPIPALPPRGREKEPPPQSSPSGGEGKFIPLLPDKPSVAVLPFTNMSGDPEQEYFSDGITEDIITDLSKLAGLMVVARNSSFAYKNKSPDIRSVGRELGVTSVLEGSIRRAGNRVRITAQLIDAASGGHLWAERYDRDMTDIFALQDEVTQRIVEALKVTLRPAEKALLANVRTHSIEAHDCFLRGRELLLGATKNREVFDRAVAFFRRAIELDSGYAEPFAGLAMAYVLDFQNHWTDTPDALDLSAHFAEQAIEKGPAEPYVHTVAAVVAFWKRDLARAKVEADQALSLNPNQAQASGTRGLAEIYSGNPQAAIPFIQRAILLDPVFTQQYIHFLGSAHLVAGQFEAAVDAFRERIRLAPKTDLSRAFLACALGHLGRLDEARRVWSELMDVNPKYSLAEHLARLPFQNAADLDRIRQGLAKAGLPS